MLQHSEDQVAKIRRRNAELASQGKALKVELKDAHQQSHKEKEKLHQQLASQRQEKMVILDTLAKIRTSRQQATQVWF